MLNMQWRSLILLIIGLIAIYIAILSQDTPYLHPEITYTSNTHPSLNAVKSSSSFHQVILTTVGSYIYLTSVQYEVPVSGSPLIGIDSLKLGVQGVVKQFRKPINNLLSKRELIETDGWTPCFQHTLKGPVSKLSIKKKSKEKEEIENPWQFAVLCHQVQDDQSYHYVRVYYTIQQQDSGDVRFEYKDIKLPGTIWVNAISLEKDSLIFSRDPDQYEFHVMTLPSNLIDPPHSSQSRELVLDSVEHGRLVQEWSQPISTEQYSTLLSRLYSPINDTYRVFTLSVHKTTSTFYVNITIADNVTMVNSENKQVKTWLEREKGESNYPVYNDESIEYVGFADISNNFQHQQNALKLNMPELYLTCSADSKSIVFPYIKNKFITLDFTDRIDILSKIPSERERLYSNDKKKTTVLQEYYYWQPYKTVDAEITGVQLNDQGDTLALWTEFNHVYIYKRGVQKENETVEQQQGGELSLLGKIDQWLDYLLSEVSEEEKELRDKYFPPSWELEMAITPIRDEYGGSRTVGTVHFWQNTNGDKYLFVAYKNGYVNSYRLDKHEPQKLVNFWTFATERWDMLFAMCMVISIFVYNEYQRM